jgi:hypothetical protein
LQSECGELREKCDRQYRRENPETNLMTVTSRYSPVSNRCLVRISAGQVGVYFNDNLYDAQTMEVLAGMRTNYYGDGPSSSGEIRRRGSTWWKARDFIERVMRGEEDGAEK